jgi:hypothetical protein
VFLFAREPHRNLAITLKMITPCAILIVEKSSHSHAPGYSGVSSDLDHGLCLEQRSGQGSPSRDAPVGHRQPKAAEVPQQQLSEPDKKLKELDDALAKKLKSICRGC